MSRKSWFLFFFLVLFAFLKPSSQTSIHTCYGIFSSNSSACSSHGQCMSIGKCLCHQGYSGEKCESKDSGILYSSGYNNDAQLAHGTIGGSITSPTISLFFNDIQVRSVAAGSYHSLILLNNETLYSVGHNGYGQLGDETKTSTKSPVLVKGSFNGNVVGMCAGPYHSSVLDNSGRVWSFGENYYSQLGIGNNVGTSTPTLVGGLLTGQDVVSVSCGYSHAVALVRSGSVFTWGDSQYGQTGHGTIANTNTPQLVDSLRFDNYRIVSISAGHDHTLALSENGRVYGWGRNAFGELGPSNIGVNQLYPIALNIAYIEGKNVTAISAGMSVSFLIADGKLYSMGLNNHGQLGINSTTATTNTQMVGEPLSTLTISRVVAGYSLHVLTTTSESNTGYAWGYNSDGELGDGTTTQRSYPVPYISSKRVLGMAVGSYHTLVITIDRSTCFGVLDNEISVCTGHGKCIDYDVCACTDGYYGTNCSIINICFDISSTDTTVCSGHGDCASADNCSCFNSYFGTNCQIHDSYLSLVINNEELSDVCVNLEFSAQVLNETAIPWYTITWSITQGNIELDTQMINSSSHVNYFPQTLELHNGYYNISATLFAVVDGINITKFDTIEKYAKCSLCTDTTQGGCRYRVHVDGAYNTTINRMKEYNLTFVDSDLMFEDPSDTFIVNLEFSWSYSIDPTTTNMVVISSNTSRTLVVKPLDSKIGMNVNTTVNLTLHLKVPSLDWQYIIFNLNTAPAEDIIPMDDISLIASPSSGYSLLDTFIFTAVNWSIPNLIYTFSFMNFSTGDYIQVCKSTSDSCVIMLPSGDPTTFSLPIRLTVFNPEDGNNGQSYMDVKVQPSCFGIQSTNASVCSGFGDCTSNDNCLCESRYHGTSCNISDCFGILSLNYTVCSGQGNCTRMDTCSCLNEYFGDNCQMHNGSLALVVKNETLDTCINLQFRVIITHDSFVTWNTLVWSITQDGKELGNQTIMNNGSPLNYYPQVIGLHNGQYEVTATIISFLIVGGGNFTESFSLEQYANCALCTDISQNNCRYKTYIYGASETINRMKEYNVTIVDSDLMLGDSSNTTIDGLEFRWEYSLDPKTTRMIFVSSNTSRTLVVKPLEGRIGMTPNTTVVFTLYLRVPFLDWHSITFNLTTTPSVDISPLESSLIINPLFGYSVRDNFQLTAFNWNLPNLIYSFSYKDEHTGKFVRLFESTSNSVMTSLSSGNQANFDLVIKLNVFNPEDGNYGLAHETITVQPSSLEKGVLLQHLERSIASGNYTMILSIASQISRTSSIQKTYNYDELKQVVSNILNYTMSNANNMEPVLVEQILLVVDMVTTNIEIVSSGDKELALGIVASIINAAKKDNSESLISKSYQSVANIISNVAGNGFSNKVVADQAILIAEDFANLIISVSFIGVPTIVKSKNFELITMIDQSSNLVNISINTQQDNINSFKIPVQFSNDTNIDVMSYSLIVFAENPYQYTDSGASEYIVSSSVIDIKFKFLNGTIIPVSNLTEPLLIVFDRNKALAQGAFPEATFECRYWSEYDDKWKSDGCSWINDGETNQISCACNHTTSFSAFVLEKGGSVENAGIGIKIIGIVFNSIYIVICFPIIIGLFIIRNEQPIRSRFIAPLLGITSIIVDSFLQGWIRNPLSLAKQQGASDTFSYIIMLTANPLFVAALFVFMWQQIRFLLLQRIYKMMPVATSGVQHKFIQINKILASKKLLSIVTAIIGTSVVCYFAVLVGLTAHYNSVRSMEKRKLFVIIQAVSFASMLILLSIGIISTFIIDTIFSVETHPEIKTNLNTQEGIANIKKEKEMGWINKYFRDDPLLFRAESCIISVTVLIIIILYSIGIATVLLESKPKSGIMIIRTLIEILLMLARIFAFGGFVLMVSVRNMILKKSSPYKKLSEESSDESTARDRIILDILHDKLGYDLVYDYCQKEFSLENLLLWEYLELIRPQNLVMSTEERRDILVGIHLLYLKNGSVRQLNISNQARKVFMKVLESRNPSTTDAEEAFAKLFSICLSKIADTFTRLENTDNYCTFIAARNMPQELKEDCCPAQQI